MLDTHAWVWSLTSPERLSPSAVAAIDEAFERGTALVSSISVWEVALLAERGRLELSMPIEDWLRKAESVPGLEYVSVDNRIAARSVSLPGFQHPDPADRIIVATTLQQPGARLVTRDRKLRDYQRVEAIW